MKTYNIPKMLFITIFALCVWNSSVFGQTNVVTTDASGKVTIKTDSLDVSDSISVGQTNFIRTVKGRVYINTFSLDATRFTIGSKPVYSGRHTMDTDTHGTDSWTDSSGQVSTTVNVGIGTTSPGAMLEVKGTGAPASGFSGYPGFSVNNHWPNGYVPESIFVRPSSGVLPAVGGQVTYRGGIGLGYGVGIYSVNENPAGSGYYGDIRFHTSVWNGSGYTNHDRMVISQSGNVGIGTTSPNHPLEMGSGAHVTTGGVWTDASSREFKENIRDLTLEEALGALQQLKPTKFNYKIDKAEEHVGFVAEDVPELVATKDRKGLSSMDIVAVLTKVVQEQQKKIETLETRLNEKR